MKKTLAEIIKDMESMSDEEKQSLLEKPLMDDSEIQPLKINKDKILKELKEAKNKLKTQKIDENDKELLTLIKESGIMDKDELGNIVNSGTTELEKAQLTIKRLEAVNNKTLKDLETVNNNFQTERQQRLTVAKNNAIVGELSKLNVNPDSMDILKDHFSNKLNTIVGDDGSISVVSKDDDVTTASEVFKSWSETEQSKQFIKAPLNKGGGSNSGNSDGKTKMSLQEIGQLATREERLQAMADNGYS